MTQAPHPAPAHRSAVGAAVQPSARRELASLFEQLGLRLTPLADDGTAANWVHAGEDLRKGLESNVQFPQAEDTPRVQQLS